MDREQSNQSLSADPVADAALYAAHLIDAEKKATNLGTLDAARNIATRHRLPQALLRALIQPSRRPKDIGQRWWARLKRAYLDALRRQLAELELEIARVEACGAPDRSVGDLLDKAQALCRRIEALID